MNSNSHPVSSDNEHNHHPAEEHRLNGLSWLPNKPRNHFVAWLGELVGTFLFLFFAFAGTQVANTAAAALNKLTPGLADVPNPGIVLYIALSFGFSLAVNAWVFFRISGGLFNPAVTLSLFLIGAVDAVRAVVVFTAQIIGGIAAAAAVHALLPGPLPVRTTLGSGVSVSRGVFIEAFATFQLVFTIFMLAAEKHKGTFLAPLGIGLALFISELGAVPFTGGSLNPARSFGPDVVLGQFARHHWVYWLGPIIGATFAVALYRIVKKLEYETANPGQDFNDHEAEVFSSQQRSSNHDGADDLEAGLGGMKNGGPLTKEDVRRPNVSIGKPEAIKTNVGPQRPFATPSPHTDVTNSSPANQPDGGSSTSTSRLQPTHDSVVGKRGSSSLDSREPHSRFS